MRGLTFDSERILFDDKDSFLEIENISSILGIISMKKNKISGHTCFKTAKAREIW